MYTRAQRQKKIQNRKRRKNMKKQPKRKNRGNKTPTPNGTTMAVLTRG
jgi:hypothetical protein